MHRGSQRSSIHAPAIQHNTYLIVVLQISIERWKNEPINRTLFLKDWL